MNMQRQFDDILLGSIELFCLAGDAGSFTAAANAAGVTPAAVSRSVARLEKRLGVRLFVRSTRSIRRPRAAGSISSIAAWPSASWPRPSDG